MEQIGQLRAFDGLQREIVVSVLCAFRARLTEHHFGVFDEVAVDGKAVRVLAEVNPVLIHRDRVVPLLQEDDVRDHIRARVCTECVFRQTDRTEEISAFSEVFPYLRGLLIHRVAGSNESNDAARTHLVERLGKEIVVNTETELVVGLVIHLILAERHVADSQIEEVLAVGGFKTGYGNISLRVELLCDPAGDAVQLHAVETGIRHFRREHTEEIANAHSGLQNVSRREAHVADSLVNGLDYCGRGIVRVQGGGSGCGVFFRRQRRVQLRKLILPVGFGLVKSVRETAPADIF